MERSLEYPVPWRASRFLAMVLVGARKAPLFCSIQTRRLCLRQLQVLLRRWQVAAGFDRPYAKAPAALATGARYHRAEFEQGPSWYGSPNVTLCELVDWRALVPC